MKTKLIAGYRVRLINGELETVKIEPVVATSAKKGEITVFLMVTVIAW